MNLLSNQRDPKRSRFPLPNNIWKWELKPQGFAILAYLCYLHVHCNKNASPSADEIASQLHMSKDMAAKQIAELNRYVLLDQHMIPILKSNSKNFFPLPNELFFLNIGHGAITVYVYLLYCENRRTHQCHPSCRTIAAAVHLSAATVMKHITKLADRQFITVENTSYIDRRGMKQNGNNLYTILPIQAAIDHCYQQQMLRLEERKNWQQAQALLAQNTENTPCAPLGGTVCAFRKGSESQCRPGVGGPIWPAFGGTLWDERKSRINDGVANAPCRKHLCPQCGQLRGLLRGLEVRSKSGWCYHLCGHNSRKPTATRKNRGQPPERRTL